MACYFFDNIWQEDKELCNDNNFLFRVYQRIVTKNLRQQREKQIELANCLLQGLYGRLSCRIFMQNVLKNTRPSSHSFDFLKKNQAKDIALDCAFETVKALKE
jgi:hypothetical protein